MLTFTRSSPFVFLSIFTFCTAFAQQNVGIGTDTPNARVDINASDPDSPTAEDGILVPRVNVLPGTASEAGMLLYLNITVGTDTPGFYFWDGSQWIAIGTDKSWSTTGNAGTTAGTNFIGTTDDTDLIFMRNNLHAGWINSALSNTGFGNKSLSPSSLAGNNSAFGSNALDSNSAGWSNTAVGSQAMFNNISGNFNAASGANALQANTTGSGNTALGFQSLTTNTIGSYNVSVGLNTMRYNLEGNNNSAIGAGSLLNNTTGNQNTSLGNDALYLNTSGSANTAVGLMALFNNTTQNKNVAVGDSALFNNGAGASDPSEASANAAIGSQALYSNATGSQNFAAGYRAGYSALGDGNIFLGHRAGFSETGSNKLYIHNDEADANEALIYGEFDNKLLRTNGRVEILTDNVSFSGLSVIKNYSSNINSDVIAVYGNNTVADFYGIGVHGEGGYIGVRGVSSQAGSGSYYGVVGNSLGNNTGTNYGVIGSAASGSTNYGVYGHATGGSINYAGYFSGHLKTTGELQLSSSGLVFDDTQVVNKGTTLKYYICTAGAFPSSGGPNSGELTGEIKLMIPYGDLANWLPCEGQIVNIIDYTALYSLVGTTYGGDGMTTFGIPDLRNAVPVME